MVLEWFVKNSERTKSLKYDQKLTEDRRRKSGITEREGVLDVVNNSSELLFIDHFSNNFDGGMRDAYQAGVATCFMKNLTLAEMSNCQREWEGESHYRKAAEECETALKEYLATPYSDCLPLSIGYVSGKIEKIKESFGKKTLRELGDLHHKHHGYRIFAEESGLAPIRKDY